MRGVQVLIIEGLHPFFDERVAELCDYKIYLDITPEVKLAWKIQRDMKERGHSLENIKASIESRKPDFDKYIDPQKANADLVIQVLPSPSALQTCSCRACLHHARVVACSSVDGTVQSLCGQLAGLAVAASCMVIFSVLGQL